MRSTVLRADLRRLKPELQQQRFGKGLRKTAAPSREIWSGNLSLVIAEPGAKYLTDRDYVIRKIPKEAEGGMLVLHDTRGPCSWLEPKSLTLTKDCMAYVAIMTKLDGREIVRGDQMAEVALP